MKPTPPATLAKRAKRMQWGVWVPAVSKDHAEYLHDMAVNSWNVIATVRKLRQ